jgi:small neutral amino acid transporter SnatA (MarC family)
MIKCKEKGYASQDTLQAITMQVMIGPGTITASVIIGKRNDLPIACIGILLSIVLCIITVILQKHLQDRIRKKREQLIQHYLDLTERITALFLGSAAIEKIMLGIQHRIDK